MRRRKFELIQTNCRRCNKTIYTGSRSLFGHNELKRKLGSICENCTTDDERREIIETQSNLFKQRRV